MILKYMKMSMKCRIFSFPMLSKTRITTKTSAVLFRVFKGFSGILMVFSVKFKVFFRFFRVFNAFLWNWGVGRKTPPPLFEENKCLFKCLLEPLFRDFYMAFQRKINAFNSKVWSLLMKCMNEILILIL